MTFSAVSTLGSATAKTFTLTPHATGDFILLWVTSETAADYATSLSSSNMSWDASPLVAHTSLPNNGVVQTVFKGQVTSTSGATATVTLSAGSPTLRIAWQEFSNTLGYSAVTLDASGTVDLASSGTMPPVTPSKSGTCTAATSSTTGAAAQAAPAATPTSSTRTPTSSRTRPPARTAAQTPNIGDSNGTCGIGVMLYEAVTSYAGAAALSGTGTLTASGKVVVPAAAALSGSGTLTSAPAVAIPASVTLLGTGALTAAASVMSPGQVSADLSGTGTLTAWIAVGWAQAATLSGVGNAHRGVHRPHAPGRRTVRYRHAHGRRGGDAEVHRRPVRRRVPEHPPGSRGTRQRRRRGIRSRRRSPESARSPSRLPGHRTGSGSGRSGRSLP